jgi:predicted O-linked N-acetylglucosamine transferase (SPINDLY family)
MRLLANVKGSVLWLFTSNNLAEINLKNEAQKRGVNPSRLVFAKTLQNDEHLARIKLADLFLDTFNFNAHTTACDALWAGIPVVTLMGKSFASRVAGSLLHSLEMPELVTTTEEDYESLALFIAKNPDKLKKLKKKIEINRESAPLFDSLKYTKNLEKALKNIFNNFKNNFH